MRERMLGFILEVVFEIMHMHVTIRETLSRGKVEITNDFVDANPTFNAAAFPTLLVEVLGIVFALTLFDTFATSKRP